MAQQAADQLLRQSGLRYEDSEGEEEQSCDAVISENEDNRDPEQRYEVAKILDHRVRVDSMGKKHVEFKVHWEGFDDTADSWNKLEDFDTADMIQAYCLKSGVSLSDTSSWPVVRDVRAREQRAQARKKARLRRRLAQ